MGEVRAAMVQTAWTGDKESMIELHEKYLSEAAAAGARVMCFQELFYGPYFCQVQDAEFYSYTEAIPDGPTTRRFQELAAKHEMVLVLPMYEKEKEMDSSTIDYRVCMANHREFAGGGGADCLQEVRAPI